MCSGDELSVCAFYYMKCTRYTRDRYAADKRIEKGCHGCVRSGHGYAGRSNRYALQASLPVCACPHCKKASRRTCWCHGRGRSTVDVAHVLMSSLRCSRPVATVSTQHLGAGPSVDSLLARHHRVSFWSAARAWWCKHPSRPYRIEILAGTACGGKALSRRYGRGFAAPKAPCKWVFSRTDLTSDLFCHHAVVV
jgi:hypothetical protein